jgi:uncharacterized protein (DUF362 family)
MYSPFDCRVTLGELDVDRSLAVEPPFLPDEAFPELRTLATGGTNPVFRAVRSLFVCSGYDAAHVGTEDWNPLGDLVAPGQTVLLKPNLVLHRSQRSDADYFSVVTHPALIRAVSAYVTIALRGRGRLLIGDAPLSSCDFSALRVNLHLDAAAEAARSTGVDAEVLDFRLYTMDKDERGVITPRRNERPGDDHLVVHMGSASSLARYDAECPRYRVTEYDGRGMNSSHHAGLHDYCIHRSVLEADVIISLPKVKTHHKAGLTCALKNYIGINGAKDWLPHHRKGSIREGGDEYREPCVRKRIISGSWDLRWRLRSRMLQRLLLIGERAVYATQRLKPFPDPFWEGSWWGNATISRTTIDLNRLALYADRVGALQAVPQRKLYYIVDGILCGEGEGPMGATPKRCGFLLTGSNALAVDATVATLMGYAPSAIDTMRVAREPHDLPLTADAGNTVRIHMADGSTLDVADLRSRIGYRFIPPHGWIGQCELPESL